MRQALMNKLITHTLALLFAEPAVCLKLDQVVDAV
jgi:hypothetical protein